MCDHDQGGPGRLNTAAVTVTEQLQNVTEVQMKLNERKRQNEKQ